MTMSIMETAVSTAANADTGKRKSEEKQLRKACADFESLFIYQLLQTLRKTLPEGHSSSQSFGKNTYTTIFDQKIAEEISRNKKGLGIQDLLYEQLKNSLKQK